MRSITAVKLTRSLARLSAATAPKASSPESPRQRLRGSSTDSSTECIRAAVTEHGLPCQVGRQAARGSADCRRCAEADQARTEQDDHFGRPARPQIEQIDEVGGRRNKCRVEQPAHKRGIPDSGKLGRARWTSAAAAAALTPTPRTLIIAAGHLTGTQRAKMPAKTLGLSRAVEVVVPTDQPRSDS